MRAALSRSILVLAALLGAAGLCLAAPAAAQEAAPVRPLVEADGAGRLCDLLTADPMDRALPAGLSGVPEGRIDGERAFAACADALEESGDEGTSARLRHRNGLGRALLALGAGQEAIAAFVAAAEAGYLPAMMRLGLLGDGHGEDLLPPEEAAAWVRKAAERGHAEAEMLLGLLYLDDVFGAPNLERGLFWLGRAMRQGHVDAKAFYGAHLHASGMVPNDDAEKRFEGARLVAEAARSGGFNAALLALVLLDSSPRLMTGPGIGFEYEEGFALMDKHARAGSRPHQIILAQYLLDGTFGLSKRHLAKDYLCMAGNSGAGYYKDITGQPLVCDES